MIGHDVFISEVGCADVLVRAPMKAAVSKAMRSLEVLTSCSGHKFELERATIDAYESHLYIQFDTGRTGRQCWEQFVVAQYGIDADVVVSTLWHGDTEGPCVTARIGNKYLGRFNPDTGRGTVILWNELIGG